MCSDPAKAGHQDALELWQQGSSRQTAGDLADAERWYRESLEVHPTAEAWTFLGWVQSQRGDSETAIEYCRKAIETDPTFGNPYNDIGAYLMALDRSTEAIPWLEQALTAPRYEARVYAWMNLGRVYERLGRFKEAINHYRRALDVQPRYAPAAQCLNRLLGRRNGHVAAT